VPFILQLSQPCHLQENYGLQILLIVSSVVAVLASDQQAKTMKLKGAKLIQYTKAPELTAAKIIRMP